MFRAALSADGLISFSIAALIFAITLLSAIHELRPTLQKTARGAWLVGLAERARVVVFGVIERAYKLRYVSLFIMLAIAISTIAPVSALLEIEENILSRACDSFKSTSFIAETASFEDCMTASKKSGLTFVESRFGETQNHLLQIAMWPLVATAYGFVIALHFRLARNSKNEPFSSVIERSPHVYHVIHGLLGVVAAAVGFIQNTIGT